MTGAVPKDTAKVVATYIYDDEDGNPLYRVERLEPKGFRQSRPDPDGRGRWIPNLNGVNSRVPYRARAVRRAMVNDQTIVIVEGEKDADRLAGLGFVATTFAGGANAWHDEYADWFVDADVVIIPDNDQPGAKYAQTIASSLRNVGAKIRQLRLPGLPLKGDVSDWLDGGGTAETLKELITKAPNFVGTASQANGAPTSQRVSPLRFHNLGEVMARVDATPLPRYLFKPVWAAGDYGMLGGEDKAGKSFMVCDAAVSVASGTPWLGIFEVDAPGPVLLFLGEGGERKMTRRMRAIGQARDLRVEDLNIRICMRAPQLTDNEAMRAVEEEVQENRPVLIIVDPLYLAASGANSSDLFEMGSYLQRAQSIAQDHGAALLISHHWNKGGKGQGAQRMTGVGPSAWGRVLISMAVVGRDLDRETKGTRVTLKLHFQGDEIPEITLTVVRRVWADDPEDLASPLHYEVTRIDQPIGTDGSASLTLRPASLQVLEVLNESGKVETVKSIGDTLAQKGHPLQKRTIQDALKELAGTGRAIDENVQSGCAGQWRSAQVALVFQENEDAL